MSINFLNLSDSIWQELDSEGDSATGYKGAYISSDGEQNSEILIFIDEKKNFHLAIAESALNEDQIEDPRVNGLALQLNKYRFDDLRVQQFIDLECNSKAFLKEFTEIVKEVAERILIQQEPPGSAVINVINGWKAFWSNRPKEILSDENQIGLICELLILKVICSQGPLFALNSWKGPLGNNYDFMFSDMVLEVKATRKDKRIHTINGIDQLKSPESKQLIFISYLVTKSESESSICLPELVGEIESVSLNLDPVLINKFRELLAGSGYNPTYTDEYKKVRFDIYDGRFFTVDDGFPKLTSDDLVGSLNSRISELSYFVDVEGINSQKIDELVLLFDDTQNS